MPKTAKFSPKLAFLSIAGSFGALLVGWLVVLARAVSRKTPIYFIIGYRSFQRTFGANTNHYPMGPTISDIGQIHPANSVFHQHMIGQNDMHISYFNFREENVKCYSHP